MKLDWTILNNILYCFDETGLIIGFVKKDINSVYKLYYNDSYIGTFITEEYAKAALEFKYNPLKNIPSNPPEEILLEEHKFDPT